MIGIALKRLPRSFVVSVTDQFGLGLNTHPAAPNAVTPTTKQRTANV
jgi:hypothetical protein